MDTSSEELQSLNEELTTVNAEMQDKNELLVKANDDLKNFLNRTDIAIVFLDEELKIRSYTPATSDVFAIRDIDIGRPFDEITSRLAYDKIAEDAGEVLRSLQPKEVEAQRRDRKWFLMRVLPYLTTQNKVSGVVISFLDIDRQKRAAERMRRLATVVRDSNDAITTQDLSGKIETWNRGAERIYGYSEAEAVGMNAVSLVPEEERTQATRFLEAIKHGKEIEPVEVKRKTKDGTILDILLTITKLVDDNGGTIGIATTERDITELKNTTTELEHLASFPELNPNPILELDEAGTVRYANAATKTMFADLLTLGKSHPLLADWDAEVAKLRSQQVHSLSRDVQIADSWYAVTMHKIPQGDHVRLYIRDVTERTRLDQMKDEFIGMVSHELKTPLTVVMGAITTGMSETLSPGDRKDPLRGCSMGHEEDGGHRGEPIGAVAVAVGAIDSAKRTAGHPRRGQEGAGVETRGTESAQVDFGPTAPSADGGGRQDTGGEDTREPGGQCDQVLASRRRGQDIRETGGRFRGGGRERPGNRHHR